MAEHPPPGHRDWLAWWDPLEGADLDPLGVDRGHGGFEVTELLLLFGVEPALTSGLWWWLVKAAVLVRHGAESGEGGTLKANGRRPT